MSKNNRIHKRRSFQQDCILANGFGMIKCKTVDASQNGVGVMINGTVPFQNGEALFVKIESNFYRSLATVQWVTQDYNIETTRAGLKVSTILP